MEYEYSAHHRKVSAPRFECLEKQKPIASGLRGLMELQFGELDLYGVGYIISEIVFPPTRLFKGVSLNQVISTICPAQNDFENYLSILNKRLLM